jgi:hypothetical protein
MWIESHQELRDHPKVKRCARTLGISVVQLVGHLHFLWWRALDYAQDGNLGGYDDADIADWAGWEGDPDEFMQALYHCGVGGRAGFIEWRGETESFWLHDWYEYAGKLIEERKRRAAHARDVRASKEKAPKDSPDTSGGREGNVTVTSGSHDPLPYHTVPTIPTKPEDTRDAAAPAPPVPIRPSKAPSPKQARLAELAEAFTSAGLRSPRFTPSEAKAAGILLAHYGPDDLARCWKDVQAGTYGDSWMKGQLSFLALSQHNRVGNWQEWCEAGRPSQARGSPNGQHRPEPAPRIVRTL